MEVKKANEVFTELREINHPGNPAETGPTKRKENFTMMKGGKGYTIADIEALSEGERAELIDGEMFMMASPLRIHQKLLIKLAFEIESYIRNHKGSCEVYPAPFAVRIKNDDRNYVEPDISVICDRDKLDEKGCQGAPDWVIEILSPSSIKMDCERKVKLYRETGVREYWIVDPEKETVAVYDFEHDRSSIEAGSHTEKSFVAAGDSGYSTDKAMANDFMPVHYTFAQRVKAGIFEDLWLDFSEMDLS